VNVHNKTVYDTWTPKMFVNLTKSHYIYFTHLNEFF